MNSLKLFVISFLFFSLEVWAESPCTSTPIFRDKVYSGCFVIESEKVHRFGVELSLHLCKTYCEQSVQMIKDVIPRLASVSMALQGSYKAEACHEGDRPRGKYLTTPMLEKFKEIDQEHHVKYFSDDECEHFKLHVENGLFYDWKHHLVDDRRKFIFVMDSNGSIYAHPVERDLANIHHSSFLSGRPVAAAGELLIRRGKLAYAVDLSGHYTPDPRFMDQFLDELLKHQVNYPFNKGDVQWARKVEDQIKREDLEPILFALRKMGAPMSQEPLASQMREVIFDSSPHMLRIKLVLKPEIFESLAKEHDLFRETLLNRICEGCESELSQLTLNPKEQIVQFFLSNPTLASSSLRPLL